jgi:hypothetical protein
MPNEPMGDREFVAWCRDGGMGGSRSPQAWDRLKAIANPSFKILYPNVFPSPEFDILCDLAMLRLDLADARKENAELRAALNTPELHDFMTGVVSEAQHQRARWGSDHDAGKLPEDWFWLLGYLAGKCLAAFKSGDSDKALHHIISTSAALANWHAAILGQTNMRPGLAEEKITALSTPVKP